MINVKAHIEAIGRYSPPWTGIDRTQYTRLDLNENGCRPPAHVRDALCHYVQDNHLQTYPDYTQFISVLSKYTGCAEKELLITNGSDQAIEVVFRSFLEAGEEILYARPEFPVFSQVANVIGAKIRGVPFGENLAFPKEEFIAAVSKQTRLIVIANPNNPTGTGVSVDWIESLLKQFPTIPVVIDEAYFEYTGVSCAHLLPKFDNLIVFRTFSKAFAMAGLRLGYIMASKYLVTQFIKVRGPFDVNSCALVAASEQIRDPSYWKDHIQEVMTQSKPFVLKFLDEVGIPYYPSEANFVLIRDHNDLVDFLKQKGILVRPMKAEGITHTFRMSIGTMEQSKLLVSTLSDYMANLKG